MESLKEEDPELVDEIRRLMFVFEDIGRFTDKDLQTVLKNVETSQWAMALKGASESLKEKVLKNMSERAAETLVHRSDELPRAHAVRQRLHVLEHRGRRLTLASRDVAEHRLHGRSQVQDAEPDVQPGPGVTAYQPVLLELR